MQATTRSRVQQRDGRTCQVCGAKPAAQLHHIIARREGGSDDLSNLVTLCGRCHMLVSPVPAHALWRAFRIPRAQITRERAKVHAAIYRWTKDITYSDITREPTPRPYQALQRTAPRSDA
jgi:5-methylcytosine-specific restriction endonuclease McrA